MPDNVQNFADQVKAAAAQVTPTERFGDDKVYISDIWDKMGRPGSLADFKSNLWQAHRGGHLMLARGDLVHLMDRTKLGHSELPVDDSTFHFLLAAPHQAPDAAAAAAAPANQGAQWRGRPIVAAEHAPELDAAAGRHETMRKMPRAAAEDRAYNDYVYQQQGNAADHHLAGMKGAKATGQHDVANMHSTMYGLHTKGMGKSLIAEPHPLSKASVEPVYRYKGHQADLYVAAALEALLRR